MAKKTISMTIDVELYDQIKQEADKKGVSFSGYVSFVCAEKIQQNTAVTVLSEALEMMKNEQDKPST